MMLKVLNLAVVVIVAAVTATAAQHTAEKPTRPIHPMPESTAAVDPWQLPSFDKSEAGAMIEAWANRHFGTSAQVFGPAVADTSAPALPLRVIETLDFAVVDVSPVRRPEGFEAARQLSSYTLCLLRDRRGHIYQASIETHVGSDTASVASIGPLLDRRPGASMRALEQRRLTELRRANTATMGHTDTPRRVIVPYPFPMDQLFYQHGADPATAVFESVWTGETYAGLGAVLDNVDDAWQRVAGRQE